MYFPMKNLADLYVDLEWEKIRKSSRRIINDGKKIPYSNECLNRNLPSVVWLIFSLSLNSPSEIRRKSICFRFQIIVGKKEPSAEIF